MEGGAGWVECHVGFRWQPASDSPLEANGLQPPAEVTVATLIASVATATLAPLYELLTLEARQLACIARQELRGLEVLYPVTVIGVPEGGGEGGGEGKYV